MRLRSLLASATVLTTTVLTTTVLTATVATLAAAPAAHAAPAAGDAPVVDPALKAEVQKGETVRAIVEVDRGQQVAPVAKSAEALSATTDVPKQPPARDFFVMEVDKATLTKLDDDERIESIYEDRLSPPTLGTSLKVIGADKAHASGRTGAGWDVAILDTGIDRDHPFFAGRIVAEACFSTTDSGQRSASLCPNGANAQTGAGAADAETAKCGSGGSLCTHGSHVAGIASGKQTAGAGGSGVAPDSGIIAIQVFSRFDSADACGGQAPCVMSYTSDQKRALAHVAELSKSRKIAAANMSLGGGRFSSSCDADPQGNGVKPEIDALLGRGVATVIAAGNSGYGAAVSSPGCISTAVTVGATDNGDAIAAFSNRGALLDVFAPGVQIMSSVPDDAWARYSGTSMAAPHVAGAFAVMRQAMPEATVAEILAAFRSTGKAVAYSSGGSGVTTPRMDLLASLPKGTPTPTPTPTGGASPAPTPTATPTAAPTPAPTGTATPAPTPTPTAPGQRPAEKRVIDLVNQARADYGCAPVVFDARLYTAALGHSTDMAGNRYFSHTSKDGRTPADRIREAGFSPLRAWAENIAWGQRSAESVTDVWMRSRGHRANILNCKLTHIAVAYAKNSGGVPYWTQVFARR